MGIPGIRQSTHAKVYSHLLYRNERNCDSWLWINSYQKSRSQLMCLNFLRHVKGGEREVGRGWGVGGCGAGRDRVYRSNANLAMFHTTVPEIG